jgi:hypothetical protein
MPPELRERSINVFVYDVHGNPVSGAAVSIKKGDVVLASAITKGQHNAPIGLRLSANLDTLTIAAKVRKVTGGGGQPKVEENLEQEQVVDVNVKTVTFQFQELDLSWDKTATAIEVPRWMPIVGVVFSVITLLFFMALVLIAVLLQRLPPPGAKYLIIITMSFGAAFSTLGLAQAAAKGSLPLPFVKERPIQFVAGGAIAAFIIVFLIGTRVYPDSPQQVPFPNYLSIGTPSPMPLGDIVKLVEKEQNVTIVFAASCAADVPGAVVDPGTHTGRDVKEFLESLQARTRPAVHYRVDSSGAKNERHEIVCY